MKGRDDHTGVAPPLRDESEFFRVDKHRLDEEYVCHPEEYHRRADALADAEEEWDQARAEKEVREAELELAEAELDRAIRATPAAFGFDSKPTEPCIKQAIVRHPDYQKGQRRVFKAQQRIIAAKHKAAVLKAAVAALDHKGGSIGGLASLQARDYFSTPRVPDAAARESLRRGAVDGAFNRKGRTR